MVSFDQINFRKEATESAQYKIVALISADIGEIQKEYFTSFFTSRHPIGNSSFVAEA